jgi:hypothetical protein
VFKEAGFGMKDELTFDDLIVILQSAERNQSGRAIIKLLEDSEKGAGIIAAANRRSVSTVPSEPIPSRTKPMEIPPVVTTIWQQAMPNSLNLVSVDSVRTALLAAHTSGDVLCSEEDLLQIIWALCEATDNSSNITFDQFWTALSQYLEATPEPGLNRSVSGASSSLSAWMGAPSDALSSDEYQICRGLFDSADPQGYGVVSVPALHLILMQTIRGSSVSARTRQCLFAVLEGLDGSGAEDVEFEEFVTICQEACLSTGAEISDFAVAESPKHNTVPKLASKKSRYTIRK